VGAVSGDRGPATGVGTSAVGHECLPDATICFPEWLRQPRLAVSVPSQLHANDPTGTVASCRRTQSPRSCEGTRSRCSSCVRSRRSQLPDRTIRLPHQPSDRVDSAKRCSYSAARGRFHIRGARRVSATGRHRPDRDGGHRPRTTGPDEDRLGRFYLRGLGYPGQSDCGPRRCARELVRHTASSCHAISYAISTHASVCSPDRSPARGG
jgi:hypothetical protein